MKGLLVKDMRMMLGQKKFFLLVLFMAIILNFNSDTTFVVYYLTFVCSFFAVNSIGHDENDNGYSFLFTLPIDRSIYVREKYLFGVIINFSSWLVGMCICFAFQAVKNNLSVFTGSIAVLALMLPVMIVFNSVVFPLLFKFGSEKGRIAMLCVIAIVFSAGYVLNQIMDLKNLVRILSGYPMPALVLLVMAVTVVLMAVSYVISVMIIKKKEL